MEASLNALKTFDFNKLNCQSLFTCSLYIKEPRFRHPQYIYIFVIDNVQLNSGQHVSITLDHFQALADIFLILKQSYM
jgi:hypothetical protein